MSRLDTLRGQTLFVVAFAHHFVEFRFLPPRDPSPVVIEFSPEPNAPEPSDPSFADGLEWYHTRSRSGQAVLRSFTSPRLTLDGRVLEYPAAGVRDALVTLLEVPVKSVAHKPGAYIRVAFATGAELELPLRGGGFHEAPSVHFELQGVTQLYQ